MLCSFYWRNIYIVLLKSLKLDDQVVWIVHVPMHCVVEYTTIVLVSSTCKMFFKFSSLKTEDYFTHAKCHLIWCIHLHIKNLNNSTIYRAMLWIMQKKFFALTSYDLCIPNLILKLEMTIDLRDSQSLIGWDNFPSQMQPWTWMLLELEVSSLAMSTFLSSTWKLEVGKHK